MSVRSMTEERLLLLISAAEAQQGALDTALQKAERDAAQAVANEQHRTQLLERQSMQLDGLIDTLERLSVMILRAWAWLGTGLILGCVVGLLIGLTTY
jgi:hypothetical protein